MKVLKKATLKGKEIVICELSSTAVTTNYRMNYSNVYIYKKQITDIWNQWWLICIYMHDFSRLCYFFYTWNLNYFVSFTRKQFNSWVLFSICLSDSERQRTHKDGERHPCRRQPSIYSEATLWWVRHIELNVKYILYQIVSLREQWCSMLWCIVLYCGWQKLVLRTELVITGSYLHLCPVFWCHIYSSRVCYWISLFTAVTKINVWTQL